MNWKLISWIVNGIRADDYMHAIREDHTRRGLLYAGTENGLYVSFNEGEQWQPLQGNLPHAPVYWITQQPHFNDLVISTSHAVAKGVNVFMEKSFAADPPGARDRPGQSHPHRGGRLRPAIGAGGRRRGRA